MSPDRLMRLNTRASRWPTEVCLLLTIGAVLGVAALRWVFEDWLEMQPLLPFFPVVVICAFLFGTRYALLASLLSFAIAFYLFVPPVFTFEASSRALLSAVLFLLVLLFTGWLVGTMKRMSLQLYAAERGKSILLGEINHRIKNNLQIMSSLLILEAARTSDPEARKVLDEAVGRMEVVGQIHTLLYQGDDAETVDASEFIGRLSRSLQSSFVGTRPITIRPHAEPLRLPVDKAVLLGIIINEAVSNALHHAFKGTSSGGVDITLESRSGNAVLTVADDGAGLGTTQGKGLGLQLIQAMGKQLSGTVLTAARQGGGTQVVVQLPLA